jgi:antitoxin CptB
MTIYIKDLKKKIIYRSTYRGTKEMDLLLSSFVKKYMDTLSESELKLLLNLLDQDDEVLYKFYKGDTKSLKMEVNKITELFKKF